MKKIIIAIFANLVLFGIAQAQEYQWRGESCTQTAKLVRELVNSNSFESKWGVKLRKASTFNLDSSILNPEEDEYLRDIFGIPPLEVLLEQGWPIFLSPDDNLFAYAVRDPWWCLSSSEPPGCPYGFAAIPLRNSWGCTTWKCICRQCTIGPRG